MKKLFFLLFCGCSAVVSADTLHVPTQFSTIQEGLNAAAPGDSILVAEGTYRENVVWPQTNDLHLLKDPADLHPPTIDGGLSGRVIDIESDGGDLQTAEVSGFIITHGFIDVPAHSGETGAGILVSNAALKVSNCVFKGNRITSSFAIQNNGGGAGLSLLSTPAGFVNHIEGCHFLFNTVTSVTSGDGPAVHLDSAPTSIKHTEIRDNAVSVNEVALGMIYDFASDLVLDGVKIEDNHARTNVSLPTGFAAIKGTAVFSYLSNVTVGNCKISGNLSTPQNTTLVSLGGALYFYGEGTHLTVTSSTIASNQRTDGAALSGASLFFLSDVPQTASVTNSILWNPDSGDEIDSFSQSATATSSDVRGGFTGNGNIDADPLFTSQTDLHLQPASPCINAGDNRFALPRDLDGKPRPLPIGTNVDLGCFELDQSAG